MRCEENGENEFLTDYIVNKSWKVWINGEERAVVTTVFDDFDQARRKAIELFPDEWKSAQHFKITPLKEE